MFVIYKECLIFEILIGGKSCNFISLYRSPSQSSDSFEEFADNLQLSLDKISKQNPFLAVVLGDFTLRAEIFAGRNFRGINFCD